MAEERKAYDRRFRRKQRWEWRKKWVRVLSVHMELVCVDCGCDLFPVLDFHHKIPDQKKFKISEMLGKKPTEKRITKMIKELEKCEVLCANCHRLRHYSHLLSKLTTNGE